MPDERTDTAGAGPSGTSGFAPGGQGASDANAVPQGASAEGAGGSEDLQEKVKNLETLVGRMGNELGDLRRYKDENEARRTAREPVDEQPAERQAVPVYQPPEAQFFYDALMESKPEEALKVVEAVAARTAERVLDAQRGADFNLYSEEEKLKELYPAELVDKHKFAMRRLLVKTQGTLKPVEAFRAVAHEDIAALRSKRDVDTALKTVKAQSGGSAPRAGSPAATPEPSGADALRKSIREAQPSPGHKAGSFSKLPG